MVAFSGYRRGDGGAGVRNYVAIIPTVYCVNEVARAVAGRFKRARALTHHQGCGLLAPDLERVTRVLVGLGTNPNVGAAVVVSLGCESVSVDRVAEGIAASGRPVAVVSLHKLGGYTAAVAAGVAATRAMARTLAASRRAPCDGAELVLGLKCGSSDTTSGLASNPAVGRASDTVVDWGGACIFTETPELMGAEHLLSARGVEPRVGERIYCAVAAMEAEVNRFGVDMRGGQPTAGNIAGGISTIEEKSLGGICKSGSAPLQGVLGCGERPPTKGLFFMDGSGRELESLTALAAAGAQAIVFSTGRGAPHGFPIVPVLKVCGNERTCAWLGEHVDVDVSGIIAGTLSLPDAGAVIVRELLETLSGRPTKAEILGYGTTLDVEVLGPPI